MEALRSPAHGLGQRRRPDRHEHELLQLQLVVGVDAAVQHVHQRHGQDVRVRAAQVPVQRLSGALGRGSRDRQRDAEHRVGPERALRGRAVEVEHRAVDRT